MVSTHPVWVPIMLAMVWGCYVCADTEIEKGKIDILKLLTKQYIEEKNMSKLEWMFTKPFIELVDGTSAFHNIDDMKLWIQAIEAVLNSPPLLRMSSQPSRFAPSGIDHKQKNSPESRSIDDIDSQSVADRRSGPDNHDRQSVVAAGDADGQVIAVAGGDNRTIIDIPPSTADAAAFSPHHIACSNQTNDSSQEPPPRLYASAPLFQPQMPSANQTAKSSTPPSLLPSTLSSLEVSTYCKSCQARIQNIPPLNLKHLAENELYVELVVAALGHNGTRIVDCDILQRALAVFMLTCFGTRSTLLLIYVLRELFYHARSMETIVEIKSFIRLVRILIMWCSNVQDLSVVKFLKQPTESIGAGWTLKLNDAEQQFWQKFRDVCDGKGSPAAMVEWYALVCSDQEEFLIWIEFCTIMGLRHWSDSSILVNLKRSAREVGLLFEEISV